MTVNTEEFMRRFLLHVLPSGLHRIRHYGLLANGARQHHINTARALLNAPAPEVYPGSNEPNTLNGSAKPTFVCRHSRGRMSSPPTWNLLRTALIEPLKSLLTVTLQQRSH